MSSPGWGRAINRALPAGPQVQVSLAPGVAEPFQQFVTAGPAPVAEARASSVSVGLLPDGRAAPAILGRRSPGRTLHTALATAQRRGISISIMRSEWHPSVPLELGPGVCLLSEEVWQPIH